MTRSIRYIFIVIIVLLCLFFVVLLAHQAIVVIDDEATHTCTHTHQISSYVGFIKSENKSLKNIYIYMARLLSLLIVYFFCQPLHHKT